MVRLLLGLPIVLGIVGCGSTYMSKTGKRYESRGLGCKFQIMTTVPKGDWEEIAIIDVNPGGYGHNTFRDIEDFKAEIAPRVCSAGGDAAIAYANGYGLWIKATVLKSLGDGAPKEPVAHPSAADGCKYDTQCKGDRVCVKGECQSPTAGAAP